MAEIFQVTPEMAGRLCRAKGTPAVQADIINIILADALTGMDYITSDVVHLDRIYKQSKFQSEDAIDATLAGLVKNQDLCKGYDFGGEFPDDNTYCLSKRLFLGVLLEAEKNNTNPTPARNLRALAQQAGRALSGAKSCVRPAEADLAGSCEQSCECV